MKSTSLINIFFCILFFLSFYLLFILLKYRNRKSTNSRRLSNKENFAWNCTWTPNINYYKEDWLLGDLSRIADGNIKQPYFN